MNVDKWWTSHNQGREGRELFPCCFLAVEKFEQFLEPPVLLTSPPPDLRIVVVCGEIQGAQEVERATGQVGCLFTEL